MKNDSDGHLRARVNRARVARIQRFPLSQVAGVCQQLREGKIDGRAVIIPQEP